MLNSLFTTALFTALSGALCVNGQVMAINHNKPIIITRLDPVVNPGAVSTHMHTVVGGSRFKATYDPEDLVNSNCTTADVPKDKSNYWAPSIYFAFNNGSIGIVNHGIQGFRTYYNNRFDTRDTYPGQVFPFPAGFTMRGGNAEIRDSMGNTTADQAQLFTCLGSNKDGDSFDFPSLEGRTECTLIRAEIHLPNCWNGIDKTSSDNSHVSYPTGGNVENGPCPAGFKRIPSLFYETFYTVDPTVMNPQTGQFLVANGDVKGWSFHGDFANGWDQPTLEAIVAQCYGQNASQFCDLVEKLQSGQTTSNCSSEGDYADEETGRDNFVTTLPGCHAIGGASTNADCPVPLIKNILTGAIVSPGSEGQSSNLTNSTTLASNSTSALLNSSSLSPLSADSNSTSVNSSSVTMLPGLKALSADATTTAQATSVSSSASNSSDKSVKSCAKSKVRRSSHRLN